MIRRLAGLVALVWVLGFAAFMLTLPPPLRDGTTTDAIAVPTGGPGRIDRGLALLRARAAHRLLVTGVAPGVGARELARRYGASPALFACCVDLDRQAVDTRSNAEETARWARAHGFRSIRLVTSDWHMRRARAELAAALGPGVVLVADGVPGDARLGLLVGEYNKLLLRRVALWAGRGR